MGDGSHYHGKKDRVFVRGVQGEYGLKEELARLRARPRVIKGRSIRFSDGPQTFSRHYVEPKDGIAQTLHIHLERPTLAVVSPGRPPRRGRARSRRTTGATPRRSVHAARRGHDATPRPRPPAC